MKMKKCLSILLAVVMIATMITSLPITAIAADVDTAGVGEGTVLPVGDATALKAACDTINNGAGGTYTISLTKNIENGQVEVTNPNAVVTVIGNAKTISAAGSAVYVSGGAKVILGDGTSNLTLTSADNNDTPGIVHILKDSSCTMKNQVTLRDHDGQNYLGGGVTVDGGTFVMDGGTITNCSIAGTDVDNDGGSVCYGGGVAVFNSGTFTMNGGTITKCYVTTEYSSSDPNHVSGVGGGVFVTSGSVFNMNGGTISDCTASLYGGGVAVVSARKTRNFKSKAVIKDGTTISGNKALGGAGVCVSGSHFAVADAIAVNATLSETSNNGNDSITGALEDDTPNSPGLYIRGGLITVNQATGTYVSDSTKAYGLGGGVLVLGLEVAAQIYNAKIISNNAYHGAGIASFYYWVKPDIDNCTITDNTAVKNGGGIAMINNTAGTSLKNTTITGNKSGDRGAGVYYDAKSLLYISGANVIQNNKYNGTLNNLNILSVDKPVYVDGTLTGSQIGLSDPRLWDDGKEDAATDAVSADKLTSGYKENNSDVHPDQYFTSDHETWFVDRTTAEAKEVDDTSIRYRQYTAKRYPVTSGDNPAGITGDYIRIEVPKTGTGAITSLQGIFNALLNLYDSKGYDVGTTVENKYKKYTAPDGTTITITAQNYYVKIDISRSSKSVTYNAYPSYQTRAADGDLYLRINSASSSSDYSFLSVPDENPVTVKYYSSAYPTNNYIYEYDDLGKITARLELEGGRNNYTTVYGKKIATIGDDKEIRLVRKKTVDCHINNDVIDYKYNNDDIFTDEITAAGTTITLGDKITSFYTVPEPATDKLHSCPYIFKGWYYDKANDNNSRPVKFDEDVYTGGKDIYAHWIEVNDVAQDSRDPYGLPNGYTAYGGFDMAGVQIREDRTRDSNFDGESKPGGMRFITSLSMDVVNEINSIQENNIEYGYVAANATSDDWITYHKEAGRKLQYASENTNGVNTVSDDPDKTSNENYFAFATNINCTSRRMNPNGVVANDHRNYNGYLLYTLVITYEGEDASAFNKNVLARPYIKYTDANGLPRVANSDYRGTSNTLGGCYTSYNYVMNHQPQEG
ncbi:MAG: hypothetical protein IJ171_07065 [Ruminococcus sp.]|nr:hypothetical protein [Ruminococcus sp.]